MSLILDIPRRSLAGTDSECFRCSPGLVCVLAIHESQVGSWKDSGLIIPEAAQYGNDWYGWVIGVGEDVQGVEWGDVVYISRWAGVEWMNRPVGQLQCLEDYKYKIENPDNRAQSIQSAGNNRWAFLRPEHIVYIVTDFAGAMGWPTHYPPNRYPGPGRIMLEHDEPPAMSAGGIIDPRLADGWLWPFAAVVMEGMRIECVTRHLRLGWAPLPGTRVVLPGERAGARLYYTSQRIDGVTYSWISADQVALIDLRESA